MENKINSLKKEIDKLLKEFLEQKQREAKKLSHLYFVLVSKIASIALSGGKRLRPILVYYGYKACKSSKVNRCDKKLHVHDFVTEKDLEKEVLKLSLAVELFHVACLIHDDIMDNAQTRRGELTIQRYFEKKYPKKLAENLAILAGDLALVWADELFHATDINAELIKTCQPLFNKLRQEVIFGQTCDLVLNKNSDENKILRMYEYKTARYSFVRPLQLGASLAGATKNNLKTLEDYAVPVGIAFQIQDDILGTFGDKTGKDSDSDIKEGKETLLINYVRKQLTDNSKQKTKFDKIFSNKNASKKDLEWVRNLIKESGSLKYCQDLAEKFIQQGKNSLKNTLVSQDTKNFLLWLADFCLIRKN